MEDFDNKSRYGPQRVKQIEMWTCDWYNFIVLDEVAKNLAP